MRVTADSRLSSGAMCRRALSLCTAEFSFKPVTLVDASFTKRVHDVEHFIGTTGLTFKVALNNMFAVEGTWDQIFQLIWDVHNLIDREDVTGIHTSINMITGRGLDLTARAGMSYADFTDANRAHTVVGAPETPPVGFFSRHWSPAGLTDAKRLDTSDRADGTQAPGLATGNNWSCPARTGAKRSHTTDRADKTQSLGVTGYDWSSSVSADAKRPHTTDKADETQSLGEISYDRSGAVSTDAKRSHTTDRADETRSLRSSSYDWSWTGCRDTKRSNAKNKAEGTLAYELCLDSLSRLETKRAKSPDSTV